MEISDGVKRLVYEEGEQLVAINKGNKEVRDLKQRYEEEMEILNIRLKENHKKLCEKIEKEKEKLENITDPERRERKLNEINIMIRNRDRWKDRLLSKKDYKELAKMYKRTFDVVFPPKTATPITEEQARYILPRQRKLGITLGTSKIGD